MPRPDRRRTDRQAVRRPTSTPLSAAHHPLGRHDGKERLQGFYGHDGVFHAWPTDDFASLRDRAIQWRARLLLDEEIDCVMRTTPGEPWAAPVNPRIVRIDGPAHGRFKKPARTDKEHRSGNDRTKWRDLGDDAAVRADFLVSGGWHIIHAGPKGSPVGPPRNGLAGEFLRAAVERDLYPVEELRAARGKHDLRSRGLRDHLAVWLYVRGNVNRRALARLFNYDPRTIDRLYERGQQMLELLEQIDMKLDVLLERLKATNPTPEEIAATIDALIVDVLAEEAA